MPEDPRLNRFFKYIKLETGLIVGALLTVLGVAGSFFAWSTWMRSSFGPMDSERLLRIVLPSVFALVLGAQVTFSSFFLSILGLRRR